MALIPVRDLSRGGILRDIHASSAPLPGWTDGRNVSFANGKVMRSPVWRKVKSDIGASPRHCVAMVPASGFDRVFIVRDDLSVGSYQSGSLTSINEAGFVAASPSASPISSTILGDVLYLNRADRVPRVLTPGASNLVALPGWDASWRCSVIRSYNEQILALNVTKGAVNVPSMVKVSDLTLYGDAPVSWDSTDPSTLAYENPLSRLKGPILDGQPLGDRFMFYTSTQVWEMRAGGPLDFTFRQVFSENGAINTNCVVEIDNFHYVFGSRDLYKTDGQTRVSLADGRIREWFFRTINMSLNSRFFVQHLPQTNEILFAAVSGDPATAWKNPTGCNSGAVYSLATNTWTFIDLPNVTSMTLCNIDSILTYATAGAATYKGIGGSYYDQQDSKETHTVAVCQALSTSDSYSVIPASAVLGYDFLDRGQLAFEVAHECVAPVFVTRTGIALDTPDVGSAPIAMAKEVRAVFPEVTTTRQEPLTITLGSQMVPSGPVLWEDPQTFDPSTDYFVNSRASGRFLAIRFTLGGYSDTEISGFDVDVVSNGFR